METESSIYTDVDYLASDTDEVVVVPTKIKKKQKNLPFTILGIHRSDIESDLLDLVFEHPPLYNYNLPMKYRGAGEVNKLWMDISEKLATLYPTCELQPDILKKLYANLRNGYIRYKTSEGKTGTSGSARIEVKKPTHYLKLTNLDDVLVKRSQKCSLDVSTEDHEDFLKDYNSQLPFASPTECSESSTRTMDANDSDTRLFPPRKRKRAEIPRTSEVSQAFLKPLNSLVDAVTSVASQSGLTSYITVPNDTEQNFGNQVAFFLRGLEVHQKYAAQLHIMTYMQSVAEGSTKQA